MITSICREFTVHRHYILQFLSLICLFLTSNFGKKGIERDRKRWEQKALEKNRNRHLKQCLAHTRWSILQLGQRCWGEGWGPLGEEDFSGLCGIPPTPTLTAVLWRQSGVTGPSTVMSAPELLNRVVTLLPWPSVSSSVKWGLWYLEGRCEKQK